LRIHQDIAHPVQLINLSLLFLLIIIQARQIYRVSSSFARAAALLEWDARECGTWYIAPHTFATYVRETEPRLAQRVRLLARDALVDPWWAGVLAGEDELCVEEIEGL